MITAVIADLSTDLSTCASSDDPYGCYWVSSSSTRLEEDTYPTTCGGYYCDVNYQVDFCSALESSMRDF